MTWSVRDAADDEAMATRVLRDLSRVCHEACVARFDEDAGYRLVHRRLWGALEGSTTEIRRGSFQAEVSVQRFGRPGASDGGGEYRVVATGGHRSVALERRAEPRATLWLTLAGAAGTTGLGIVGLQLAGLLSAWGQLMLMLPLLILWRMMMALRIAEDLRRDATQQALAAAPRMNPGSADDLARWRRTLEAIATQRDAVAEAFCGPGFRTPGAVPGSVAAMGARPLLPATPSRAIAVPNLSMPPLGRTTAM